MTEVLQFGLSADAASVALRWLSSLKSERRMAAKTLEAYALDLSQFGGFLAEHLGVVAHVRALENLTASDFRSFMAKRRGAGIQSRSLARQMSAIRSFFRYAERNEIFKCAALASVRAPKIAHSIPRPLPEISARLVAAADVFEAQEPWVKARDAAVLTLLYGCGLRISEALALTPRQVQSNPLVIIGKGGKSRIVPMVKAAEAAIAEYIKLCPLVLSPHEALFRGVKGGILSPRIIQLLMEKMRGALNLPDSATPHALRHSFASHLLGNGADLRVIQDLLGHASLSSTQIYTEVNKTHLLEQYRKAFARS